MQPEEIRLLHLLKSLEIGGIEKSTITYSNILVNKLDSVGIFSRKGRFTKENIIDKKVQLFSNVKGTIGLNKYFLMNLFYLIRVIRKYQINLIFYHFRVYIPFILVIKFLFPKIKVIYVCHSYFNDLLNYLVYADNYIAVSVISERDLINFGKLKISLIAHGIKTHNNIAPNTSEVKCIAYIGRFEKQKGIDILLEAFKELVTENNKIILKLIGEGNEENYIYSFIERYNLQNNIVIKSAMIMEEKLFAAIDLLVFPSTSIEGFGLVILEAMNFGMPVLASDLIKENSLIEDYKNGIYFRNGDSVDLVKKLKLIIEDNNLRKSISANAKEMIKVKFNLENTMSGYLKFLEQI